MLRLDRKQENSVKQLSFNKKIKTKNESTEITLDKGKMVIRRGGRWLLEILMKKGGTD